jgi:hypothetical protein
LASGIFLSEKFSRTLDNPVNCRANTWIKKMVAFPHSILFFSILFFFKMGDNKRWPDLFLLSLERDKERVALVYPIKKKKGQLHFFIPFIGLYKSCLFFLF